MLGTVLLTAGEVMLNPSTYAFLIKLQPLLMAGTIGGLIYGIIQSIRYNKLASIFALILACGLTIAIINNPSLLLILGNYIFDILFYILKEVAING